MSRAVYPQDISTIDTFQSELPIPLSVASSLNLWGGWHMWSDCDLLRQSTSTVKLKCWEAWDTATRHKAKDITSLIGEYEVTWGSRLWNAQNRPSSGVQTAEFHFVLRNASMHGTQSKMFEESRLSSVPAINNSVLYKQTSCFRVVKSAWCFPSVCFVLWSQLGASF